MPATSPPFSVVDDPVGILNWRRLDGRVTTSGQPTEGQLEEIQKLGVTHIVNLALHSHEKALRDERATVTALEMTYIHIPVDFAAPTEADFDSFSEAMKATETCQVHVHCIVNARVSAFVYRFQRDVMGLEQRRAWALMESVWRPGGVWAAFIGNDEDTALPHRFAGRDY
jgi:protein tyrosine phosphatase (PTP) superfamily phosphohydrolase (DUF442 family)